jgi:hypothetical protein
LLEENSEYAIPPQLEKWANRMPVNDFLVPPHAPELCLEHLMQNPKNKMAFEYYMAYSMLAGKVSELAKNVHRLQQFDYKHIPRHVEEALMIYIQLTGNDALGLPGWRIRPKTIERFLDFNRILNRHNKNKLLAQGELVQKYRDTYWYYAFYYFKSRGN